MSHMDLLKPEVIMFQLPNILIKYITYYVVKT